MTFTSQTFVYFCLLFFPAYFITKGSRLNNYIIVAASCVFYGWWDWRFVVLFGITTCIDFFAAQWIAREIDGKRRSMLLWFSMLSNLLMLGFFKYFNFLVANFGLLMKPTGITFGDWYLAVILPAGISFYTFQSMGYTIDVYQAPH